MADSAAAVLRNENWNVWTYIMSLGGRDWALIIIINLIIACGLDRIGCK